MFASTRHSKHRCDEEVISYNGNCERLIIKVCVCACKRGWARARACVCVCVCVRVITAFFHLVQ